MHYANLSNLSNLSINQACGEMTDYLNSCGLVQKEILRLVFTAEEALLRYQEVLGAQQAFSLTCGKKWGKHRISLAVSLMRCWAPTRY